MGLFSGVETDEVQSGGGFLKRFRGVRLSAFVEPGQGTSQQPGLEPAFREPTRAINPTVSFLGRKLSGDDVEDVESFTEFDRDVADVAAPVAARAVPAAPLTTFGSLLSRSPR